LNHVENQLAALSQAVLVLTVIVGGQLRASKAEDEAGLTDGHSNEFVAAAYLVMSGVIMYCAGLVAWYLSRDTSVDVCESHRATGKECPLPKADGSSYCAKHTCEELKCVRLKSSRTVMCKRCASGIAPDVADAPIVVVVATEKPKKKNQSKKSKSSASSVEAAATKKTTKRDLAKASKKKAAQPGPDAATAEFAANKGRAVANPLFDGNLVAFSSENTDGYIAVDIEPETVSAPAKRKKGSKKKAATDEPEEAFGFQSSEQVADVGSETKSAPANSKRKESSKKKGSKKKGTVDQSEN